MSFKPFNENGYLPLVGCETPRSETYHWLDDFAPRTLHFDGAKVTNGKS
jgi:hypothetical protein